MIRGLVLLAAAGLMMLPTTATAAPELKIETANVTRANGTTIELGLGLKAAARARHKVQVWLIGQRRPKKLWEGTPTFSRTRGGFRNAVTVNVPSNASKAKLKVVAPVCSGRGCKKIVSLGGGANLKFDGAPNIERRGSDSILAIKVKNTGFASSRGCKLQVRVAGRKAKTFRVPAIRKNASKTFEFRYRGDKRGKKYETRLVCRDLVRFDNKKDARLR